MHINNLKSGVKRVWRSATGQGEVAINKNRSCCTPDSEKELYVEDGGALEPAAQGGRGLSLSRHIQDLPATVPVSPALGGIALAWGWIRGSQGPLQPLLFCYSLLDCA